MFEAAELGKEISEQEYERQTTPLREKLIDVQQRLKNAGIPVIIIISGVDGAGKGEVVHRLNEWFDPRGLATEAFSRKSDEEAERPYYFRYWRALPARGRISIFFGSWYTEPIAKRALGKSDVDALDRALFRISFFENELVQDGLLIIKLWFHISKKEQYKRLTELDKDPQTHWRVLPDDWKYLKYYKKYLRASERAIRETDLGHAPWRLIEAKDRCYRELTAGQVILERCEQHLARLNKRSSKKAAKKPALAPAPVVKGKTILDSVDLSKRLTESDYKKQLDRYQNQLGQLTWQASKKGVSVVAAFEGWDAAGKGSAIRRVTSALDPRLYRVIPISAPNDEEQAHHYLWRFWRRLPREGEFAIFDRSWYGRVLVERVEGFATPDEWGRAYGEINDFEEQLHEHGILVFKFWLHISKEEQLRRFKKREEVGYKRYKITPDDWRNRKKWDLYKAAVNDMIFHTSTEYARWQIIAGNDKKSARIQVLQHLCEGLERCL